MKCILMAGLFALTTSAAFAESATSKISCTFYAGDASTSLEVTASFSPKRTPTVSKQDSLNGYVIKLASFGGDGGEPGNVVLTISQAGKMITRTLWQIYDSMAKAGNTTGKIAITENLGAPGGADIQYSCESN